MRTAMLIVLAMLGLTALGALAFAGWRLMANLRDLARAAARAQAALAPGLAELARQSQIAAERAAAIQARRAGPAGGPGSGSLGDPVGGPGGAGPGSRRVGGQGPGDLGSGRVAGAGAGDQGRRGGHRASQEGLDGDAADGRDR